jgi:hypothetical protein
LFPSLFAYETVSKLSRTLLPVPLYRSSQALSAPTGVVVLPEAKRTGRAAPLGSKRVYWTDVS